jgi:hypothetical protein
MEKPKTITRRDFLKFAAKAAATTTGTAAFLAGCGGESGGGSKFEAVYGEGGKLVGFIEKVGPNKNVFYPISEVVTSEAGGVQTTPTAAETPTPTEEPTATPTPKPKEEPTGETKATETKERDIDNINPAQRNGDRWTLSDSDGNQIELKLPANFIPDKDLKVSDIKPENVLPIPEKAADFQRYLNTKDNPLKEPLAGYMYGTNDYNQYGERKSGPQLPMYSWLIFTGEVVSVPGIGKVTGSPGKAVAILIINRTDKVHQWSPETVYVKSGFQGAGRIWNGEAPYVAEAERRLVQHYGYILGNGHPESGFIGQCDLVDNCRNVTFITAERIQWGNNRDGTPRYQFRLIRAEDIKLK